MTEGNKTLAQQEVENQNSAEGLSENDLFNYDREEASLQDDEDQKDFSEFDYVGENTPASTEGSEEESEEEESEEEDLFSEEEESEDDSEITDADLALFNKKLGKEFKDTAELKAFLNKDAAPAQESNDEEEYKEAVSTIELYENFMKMDDKALMIEQYRTIARQDKTLADLDDDEKNEWAEEQVADLIDNKTISLHAKALRDEINAKGLAPAQAKKQQIEAARTEKQQKQQKEEREQYENALAEIYHNKNFFGVEPDKQTIRQVFKKVTSGEFLENLQKDKKALAELAMMAELKEVIYKKSSGLNYNDGIGAVLNEFKKKKNKEGGSNPIIKAQSRGTIGSGSSQGIVNSLVK